MNKDLKYYVGLGVIALLGVMAINKFLPFRTSAYASGNCINGTVQNSSGNNLEATLNNESSNNIVDPRAEAALKYYAEKTGESIDSNTIQAIVENFGCHTEIHVYKNDELVMRTAYFNGQIYEL